MLEAHTAYHRRHLGNIAYLHRLVKGDIQLIQHFLLVLVGIKMHPVIEVFIAGRIVILWGVRTVNDKRMGRRACLPAVYPEVYRCFYDEHEPAVCAVGTVYAEAPAVSVIVSYFDHSQSDALLFIFL